LDPDTRRGLITDATERLLAEHDPLLVTFEQVAEAAGVSRALVHTYLGDRRGLIDAVQVQIIARLETWVGHGLQRADHRVGRLRAIVAGTFSFVEADRDAWGTLGATGGFDHPALHGVRARWAATLGADSAGTGGTDGTAEAAGAAGAAEAAEDGASTVLGAQAALGALLANVGTWVNRGVDPDRVTEALQRLFSPGPTPDA
jgi:AcrR family transcriptional regulator